MCTGRGPFYEAHDDVKDRECRGMCLCRTSLLSQRRSERAVVLHVSDIIRVTVSYSGRNFSRLEAGAIQRGTGCRH